MATPSLAMIPSGYKEEKLYSFLPVPSYGEEEVTNGSFATDSGDWGKGTGWSISSNVASCDGTQSSPSNLSQGVGGVVGNTYTVTYTVSNYISGSVTAKVGASTVTTQRSANGTYTEAMTVGTNGILYVIASSNFIGSIDNISVKEVLVGDGDFTFSRGSNATRVNKDGLIETISLDYGSELVTNGDFATDSDWTKGSNTTISSGTLNFSSASSNTDQSLTTVNSKVYQVIFSVSNYVSGSVRFRFTGTANVTGINRSANGTFTEYITSTADNAIFRFAASSFTGSIDNVSVKEVIGGYNKPRLDYSDSSCPSLLLEPTRTNLFTYSEDFTQDWLQGGSGAFTITPNAVISPNGTQNASKLIASGTGYQLRQNKSIINTQMSSSFYMRTNQGTRQMSIRINDYEIQETFVVTSEWKRYTVSGLVGGTLNGSGRCILTNEDVLDENNHVYIWGAQLEVGSYATSYIPTTDGIVKTRLQDECTDAGDSSTFNDSEGVLFAEIKGFISSDTVEPNRYITLTDGTSNERVALLLGGNNNQLRVIIYSSTQSVNLSFTTSLTEVKQFNKLAVKYKSGDYAFFLNGVKIDSSTETNIFSANTLNDCSFDVGGGTQQFRGNVKDLRVYNTALTDLELEGISSWESFIAMANAQNYTTK